MAGDQQGERETMMARSNLDRVLAALAAGLSLSTWDEQGNERVFLTGQITRQVNERGSVRTTHLSKNLKSSVWLTRVGIFSVGTTGN